MSHDRSHFRVPGKEAYRLGIPQGRCVSCDDESAADQTLRTALISPSSFARSDENAAVARAYSVSAMPTFVFLKNKSVIETLRGANPSQLTSLVEKHASSSSSSGSGSSFSGKGNTLSGGSVSGSRSSGAGNGGGGGGVGAWMQGLSRDNALPLLVLAGYLGYVIYNKTLA